METLTIRLSETLKQGLEQISEMRACAVSDVVRDSIRRYVAVERFRALRKKILPFAEAEGLLTDDDVFAALS